jgi:hypothetical protein
MQKKGISVKPSWMSILLCSFYYAQREHKHQTSGLSHSSSALQMASVHQHTKLETHGG